MPMVPIGVSVLVVSTPLLQSPHFVLSGRIIKYYIAGRSAALSSERIHSTTAPSLVLIMPAGSL